MLILKMFACKILDDIDLLLYKFLIYVNHTDAATCDNQKKS